MKKIITFLVLTFCGINQVFASSRGNDGLYSSCQMDYDFGWFGTLAFWFVLSLALAVYTAKKIRNKELNNEKSGVLLKTIVICSLSLCTLLFGFMLYSILGEGPTRGNNYPYHTILEKIPIRSKYCRCDIC